MNKSVLIFVLAGWVSIQPAFSQIDESDTARLQLNTTLTGRCQMGNVELLLIKAKFDLSSQLGKSFVLKSQNTSLYQEFANQKVDNDLSSRNFLYFNPEQKLYPLAMFFASTNFRRKVNNRFLYGLGLTYQALKQGNHTIKISVSSFYESSNFDAQSFN